MQMICILVGIAYSATFQQVIRQFGQPERAVGQDEDGPPACFDFSLASCLTVFDASGEPKDDATPEGMCNCFAVQGDQNCVLYTFEDSFGTLDVTVAMHYSVACTASYSMDDNDGYSSSDYPWVSDYSSMDGIIDYPSMYDSIMDYSSMDDGDMDYSSMDDTDDGVKKECILESDYAGAHGDCFQFESEKYAPFCTTDYMIMEDEGIVEHVYALEACSQCGMCTSRSQPIVVEPAGSPFCGDKTDEEFVPLCGACLYSSQCLGHKDSFNSDYMHEIYCCPNTKMCMKMGQCTMDDIRAHPNYLADSTWDPSYASCGNTRQNPGCSERHDVYPNECSCEDSNFPVNWVECPIAADSASYALNIIKVQGDVLVNGLAIVGFVALVYGGIQFFKVKKIYQTVSFDTEDV